MVQRNIKNMVCPRCVESVQAIVNTLGLPVESVEMGVATFNRSLTEQEVDQLNSKLLDRGFELILDRESELVNGVKSALIEYLHHLENTDNPQKLSVFVSEKLRHNYSYLSSIYSEKEGRTVENQLIRLKIERVKELLSYRKWTLSEIAWMLKYSSVQYLSNQFKKVTGQTVTSYLRSGDFSRKSLHEV